MLAPSIAVTFAGEASVRRYIGTAAEMHQPALDDNMLCMHLGGPKEVRRWHDGHTDVHSVELGALTLMPAHQTNRWQTRGPIDFAHLMVSPGLVRQIGLQEFDRDASTFHFTDSVGFRDPYVEMLFGELLTAAEGGWPAGQLYAESLLTVLTYRLLQRYSTLGSATTAHTPGIVHYRGGLAPWRLQRVVDYMEAQMASDIALSELTVLVGLSRAQFFRAFKQSTGMSPHRYLMVMRLERAQALLRLPGAEATEIRSAVGLQSPVRFATLFRQRFGLSPAAYLASVRS